MKNFFGFWYRSVSTFLCCFLTVLLLSSCDRLKDSEKAAAEDKAKEEAAAMKNERDHLLEDIRIKKATLEKLEDELAITKLPKELENINNRIKLLENAETNIKNILGQPLLQTNIKYPLVKKDPIGEPVKRTVLGEKTPSAKKDSLSGSFLGKVADGTAAAFDWLKTHEPDWGSYNDDMLVVIDYEMGSKFNVDINDIKVSKTDENITVSGIHPKCYETSKTKKVLVREVRRNIHDKKGALSSTVVQLGGNAITTGRDLAEKYEDEFQQRMRDGTELPFMEDAVAKIAQVAITAALSPLYKNIKFDNADRPESLPIVEYLQKELTDANDRKNKLLESKKNLISKDEKQGDE